MSVIFSIDGPTCPSKKMIWAEVVLGRDDPDGPLFRRTPSRSTLQKGKTNASHENKKVGNSQSLGTHHISRASKHGLYGICVDSLLYRHMCRDILWYRFLYNKIDNSNVFPLLNSKFDI